MEIEIGKDQKEKFFRSIRNANQTFQRLGEFTKQAGIALDSWCQAAREREEEK